MSIILKKMKMNLIEGNLSINILKKMKMYLIEGMEIFFDMALEALFNNVYIMVEEVEKLEE